MNRTHTSTISNWSSHQHQSLSSRRKRILGVGESWLSKRRILKYLETITKNLYDHRAKQLSQSQDPNQELVLQNPRVTMWCDRLLYLQNGEVITSTALLSQTQKNLKLSKKNVLNITTEGLSTGSDNHYACNLAGSFQGFLFCKNYKQIKHRKYCCILL